MQAHGARRGGQLNLHREDAASGDEIAQRPQLARVQLVDRGVDRDRQAARYAGVDGGDHARVGAGLAELVMLDLEAVQAEGRAYEAGRLGALDVAGVPVPAVGDEVDLDAVVGQTLADLVPVGVQGRLATAQGHAPAAERRQLVGDLEILFQGHLVVALAARERAAVFAA